jgi:glycosyltransferase involved in cell wall biosynthesis
MRLEVLTPSREGRGGLQRVCGIPVYRYRYAPSRSEMLHQMVSAKKALDGLWRLSLPGLGMVAAGALAARRLAGRTRYDVIHSHWPLPAGIIALAGASAFPDRPRLISTFHGAELAACSASRTLRRLLAGISSGLDAAVANSTYTASLVREMTGVAPCVIPFGPSRASLGSDDRTARQRPALVLSVGRLVERKGFPILVRAAVRLRGREQVVIAGEGEAHEEIAREIAVRGVGDRVRIAGRVSGPELVRLYRKSSVFCLPAVVDRRGCTEGLGVVIVEAMNHGLPVVASRVGGIPDVVVHGETGLLVKPGDPEALARALLRLLGDPALARRMGEAGRSRAARLFSWERVVEDHLALYKKVIEGGPCAGSPPFRRGP